MRSSNENMRIYRIVQLRQKNGISRIAFSKPCHFGRINNYGFTFIEIIVVVAILWLLAGLIIPRYRSMEDRTTIARAQMKEIMKALELYKQDNGHYPSTIQGLRALVKEPTDEPKPQKWRTYIDKIPADPWKNSFIYRCPGVAHTRKGVAEHEKREGKYVYYDLICTGPDGIEGNKDDINSWDIKEAIGNRNRQEWKMPPAARRKHS